MEEALLVLTRPRPLFRRRRRSPSLRIGAVVLGLLLLSSLLAASPLQPWSGPPDARGVGPITAVAEPARSTLGTAPARKATQAPAPATPATPAFAAVDGVTLHLPAPDVVLVGFHEASSRDARAFLPIGRVEDHQNTTKLDPPPDVLDGPPYVVLSSRGRPYPATSAVDVLLEGDVPVRSPVTGTVTDVRGYVLYGRHADQRIEIAPEGAPGSRVVMIHLDGVSVSVGDEVLAGESVVAAAARLFPFGSHIDRYTEPDRHPHVHYELKLASAD